MQCPNTFHNWNINLGVKLCIISPAGLNSRDNKLLPFCPHYIPKIKESSQTIEAIFEGVPGIHMVPEKIKLLMCVSVDLQIMAM